MTWLSILSHWVDIENDLQDRGIDLDDPQIRTRTGRWLRTRITGLLSAPAVHTPVGPVAATRLQRALAPKT